MTARVIAPVLAVATLLAGCGGADPEPTEDAIPSPDPTPTASPVPAGLYLHPDGLGTMLLREPVGADDAFAIYDADGCTDLGYAPGEPYAGYWVSAGPEHSFFALTADGREDGPVSYISAVAVTTAEGIAIGSTLEEVETAYGDLVDEIVVGWASDVYVIEGERGRLAIEVTREPDDGPYWEPDQVDRVLLLVSTSGEASPVAGSDGGGPCPP